MPSEPKKPIEEMLEASAKARRAAFGSDPKMPNPMRARLHEEIARRGAEEEAKPRVSWLQLFWPRLAVAAAMATLLVIGPLMWWRASHPESGGMTQVAGRGPGAANEMREAAAAPDKVFTEGPAAAGATAPEVSLADNSRARLEPAGTPASAAERIDESKRLADAETMRAQPNEITRNFDSKDDAAKEHQNGIAAAPAAPARQAAVSSSHNQPAAAAMQRSGQPGESRQDRLAAGGTTGRGVGVTAQFSQRAGGQSFRNNSNQNANILNTFQVQQEGTEIRVVDSDGSTYTGKIEPVTEMADRAMAKRKQGYESRLEKDNKTETAQSRFRASGYNVSMKKQLIFEGDYVAPLQAPVAQQLDIGKKADTAAPQQQQQAARITGTARVNGEAPVQVDATEVPASPTEK